MRTLSCAGSSFMTFARSTASPGFGTTSGDARYQLSMPVNAPGWPPGLEVAGALLGVSQG